MATIGSRGNSLDNTPNRQFKSGFASPEKVRELLNAGVLSNENRLNGTQGELVSAAPNGNSQVPCEASNKDGFFTRVESYSCLKWAGKPRTLSPLRCASYGWINMGCDMLKCSSCKAFLCASLQPTLDFRKYESRVAEITGQLQTQHEKFCPWPDFPCPDRFWLVPINEPSVLLSSFLERYHTTCLLEQQLPAMKPEQLKNMSLTEDVISILLELIEDEVKKQGMSPLKSTSVALPVQVAACIVALCGWAGSPALNSMSLPILTCSFCMRKVGTWNFHQMEGTGKAAEGDSPKSPSTPTSSTPLPALEAPAQGERKMPTSPSPCPTPCRRGLRSQDKTRGSEQRDGSPGPVVFRTRSRDSPSPGEEPPSPLLKGKRPVTRSRGQSEGTESEGTASGASSPQRNPKRLCLSSANSPEGPLQRNVFDPLAQHRDWCPWVNVEENSQPCGGIPVPGQDGEVQQGWKSALNQLLTMKKSFTSNKETSPSQDPHEKSKRVFAIFRQWQVSSPS
ncbi:nuclear-interacting partner of ALK [Esox lucius]|uniref:Zinc finger, C3HC-type containing 1 n=1 Tax=Esox lucius TaxID=8010 RepID=A0A3P9AM09_ESOLU|nr:nuclear-interacting partner of ALK [Esox lucius]